MQPHLCDASRRHLSRKNSEDFLADYVLQFHDFFLEFSWESCLNKGIAFDSYAIS